MTRTVITDSGFIIQRAAPIVITALSASSAMTVWTAWSVITFIILKT